MLSDQTRCQAIGKEKIINNLYIYICLKASLNIIGSICSPPAETLLEIIAFNKILPKSWELNVKRRAAATSFVAKIGEGQIIIMSLTLKSSEFNIASPKFFCPLYCCHLALKAAVQFSEQFTVFFEEFTVVVTFKIHFESLYVFVDLI